MSKYDNIGMSRGGSGYYNINEKREVKMAVILDRKRFNRRKRRELGLTAGQVRSGVKQLVKDGDVDSGTSRREISVLYMAELPVSDEYGEAWSKLEADGEVDWDAIIAFIEKLLELIMKYLPMFV